MDFIKQWVLGVCITLILSVFFSLLTPKGNMGRIYKVILAMFIFISFILPLGSGDFDVSVPEFDFSLAENQEESYKNLVENNIRISLENGGYTSCIIDCDVEYSNDEIIVNSLTVSIPSQYDKQEVEKYIYDELGMVAEVCSLGE